MHTMAKMGLSIPLKMLKKKKLEKESPETLTQIIKSQFATFVDPKTVHSFVEGVKVSVVACSNALKEESIRSSYLKKFKELALLFVLIFFGSRLAVLPLNYCMKWVKSITGHTWGFGHLVGWLQNSVSSVPFICMGLYRYMNGSFFDSIFMAGLHYTDPTFGQDLKKVKYDWVSNMLKRLWRYAWMSCALTISVVVAPFMLPMLLQYMATQYFGYKLKHMNWILVACTLIAFFVPSIKSAVFFAIMWWKDARCILREAMDPYLSRRNVPFSAFFRHHESFLLGFYLPFLLLSKISYLQPFVWILASAACGQLIPQFDALVDHRENEKLKGK